MTSFYALKRYYATTRWNWPLLSGCLFSLAVWAGVIVLVLRATGFWKAVELFLQRVGLGG